MSKQIDISKDIQLFLESTTTADMAVSDKGAFSKKKASKVDSFKNSETHGEKGKTAKPDIDKFEFLKESYFLKSYNLFEGKDSAQFIVETNRFGVKAVKVNRNDFVKFVRHNCDVRQFVNEGVFNYKQYMQSRPIHFTQYILEAYLNSKNITKKKMTKEAVAGPKQTSINEGFMDRSTQYKTDLFNQKKKIS